MDGAVDHSIFDFDRDLHVEARSVLTLSPEPQNNFEVAVILETQGYTDEMARSLGSPDIFALAERVFAVLSLYTGDTIADAARPATEPASAAPAASRMPVLILRGLLYSVPWLFALAALLVSRVSFWSTITTVQFSSTISLALFVALVLSGGFVQAFARRGTFYALQGNFPLLSWVTRWTLGVAVLVALLVCGGLYVLLEWGLRAYTPSATWAFLWFGLSITGMLLALAPLYMARAFGAVAVTVGAGAVFLILAGQYITHGDYINPYTAMRVQLVAIWVVVVLATAADMIVLRRAVVSGADPLAGPVRPPRLSAVARSVGGYAAYGACFFLLIIVDQLVAGGLWRGQFVYDGRYELAVGVGLLVLIATLTYVVAVSERFPHVVRAALRRYSVAEVVRLRGHLASFYRRHLAVLLLIGIGAAVTLLALASWSPGFAAIFSTHPSIRAVIGLFGGALTAYVLLSVGALNSGLLFALARPAAPALGTALGSLVSFVVGGLAGWIWQPEAGALLGLVAGTALFGAVTTHVAWRAFRDFDASYYRAF
ncbi:MAG: hypothetical protein ACRDN9_16070 [Streptosporangiaceae bacterium]